MFLQEARNRPEGASVPALGLSNKAVFSEGLPPDPTEDMEIKPGTNEQYADNVFTAVSLKGKILSSVKREREIERERERESVHFEIYIVNHSVQAQERGNEKKIMLWF